MKYDQSRKSNLGKMESNSKPFARHSVLRSPRPYLAHRGIRLADQCNNRITSLASESFLDRIFGSGLLFEDEKDYPFKTFCKNDAFAINTDWNAAGADLAQAVHSLVAARGKEFERDFFKNLISLLLSDRNEEAQLSLPLEGDNIDESRRFKQKPSP